MNGKCTLKVRISDKVSLVFFEVMDGLVVDIFSGDVLYRPMHYIHISSGEVLLV